MKPFHCPSDNPFDWLNADRCRPAEHESYLSKSPNDETREQDHTIEQQPHRPGPGVPDEDAWIAVPPRLQSPPRAIIADDEITQTVAAAVALDGDKVQIEPI